MQPPASKHSNAATNRAAVCDRGALQAIRPLAGALANSDEPGSWSLIVPGLGRTCAELEPEEKNSISHRGQAFRKLKDELPRLLSLAAGKEHG